MSEENIGSSQPNEDYDVILENESCASEVFRMVATILLTAVVVSGVGYVAHIYIVDKNENDLQAQINRLESRVIAEIRSARGIGGKNDGKVQELETKLKQAEEEKKTLEEKIVSLSKEKDDAENKEKEQSEEAEQLEDVLQNE